MKPLYLFSRPLKWLLAGVLLAALLLTAWWWLQRGSLVQVVPVQRQDLLQSVVATGRLNAPARIELAAEVTAAVSAVLVREGDHVKAGQLLLQLSDAEARAALQQARAAWLEASNRATQQATVAAPVSTQGVVQTQAAFHAAERDHQRTRELVAQGFFSQQKLDESRRTLDTAASALQSAQVQAAANQPAGVESSLSASRVAQAGAAVQMAEARLARLALRSPVDAVVLARNVEPGSLAQPGRLLLALAAEGGIRIDTAIEEKHLHMLTPGMPARASADAYPGQSFAAQLSYIGPAVDPQRGTVEVRLAVTQPPAFLKPDMTVSVELLGASRPATLVLPATAVRNAGGDAPWVLVLRARHAVRVPVQLGLRGIGTVEITGGLNEGELAIPQTEKAVPGDAVRSGTPSVVGKTMDVSAIPSR
jgi:HlyD family secretion protein